MSGSKNLDLVKQTYEQCPLLLFRIRFMNLGMVREIRSFLKLILTNTKGIFCQLNKERNNPLIKKVLYDTE